MNTKLKRSEANLVIIRTSSSQEAKKIWLKNCKLTTLFKKGSQTSVDTRGQYLDDVDIILKG